jgi:hypothetical protein
VGDRAPVPFPGPRSPCGGFPSAARRLRPRGPETSGSCSPRRAGSRAAGRPRRVPMPSRRGLRCGAAVLGEACEAPLALYGRDVCLSSAFYAPRCASLREPHACTFPCSTTRLDARALAVVNCEFFRTGTVTWTCLLFPWKGRERTPRTTSSMQEAYRLKWANI